MLHRSRIWSVTSVTSADELAEKLTEHTWTCCQAFELQAYIFASDATCGDGAQEYAVLRREATFGEYVQIESITFSWGSEEQALALIQRITTSEFNSFIYGRVLARRFQSPREHGHCALCK